MVEAHKEEEQEGEKVGGHGGRRREYSDVFWLDEL